MDVFIGTVMPVAFEFAPRGWALCNGQLLPVSQNAALFSLLSNNFGGDGVNTFGLPDLRGRVIVGSQAGQVGPGLDPVQRGQIGGANNASVAGNGQALFTISSNNLPSHSHSAATTLQASTGTTGLSNNATAGALLSSTPTGAPGAQMYLPSSSPPVSPVNLGGIATSIGNTGGGQPVIAPVSTQATVSLMQPYIGINYIIALEGNYPTPN